MVVEIWRPANFLVTPDNIMSECITDAALADLQLGQIQRAG